MQYIIYKYNLSIQIKEIFAEKIHGIWLCVKTTYEYRCRGLLFIFFFSWKKTVNFGYMYIII